ncbi:MAG: hypothetical protein ACR2O4_02740, partial [Hyphomicrobiaceae bacterium]
DKTWGVNASIWGHNSSPKRLYVQIGEGKKYRFCKKKFTPLEAMLSQGYYEPKLVVFYLLGNGASRWANHPERAEEDVNRLSEQIPVGTRCIFMTTAPSHTKWRNRIRMKAQARIQAAFAAGGNRCSFIAALTPESVAAIEGKNRYFRRRKNGTVKDPFHPDARATKKFLELNKKELCTAVTEAFEMKVVADNTIDPRLAVRPGK